MKYGILVCILCLVIIGTASAAAINPVIVKQTYIAHVVTLAPPTAEIMFNSSVPGATVYLDGALLGSDEAHSRTPMKANVVAGDHTATFRLAGYQEAVTSFTVVAGRTRTVYVELERSIDLIAARQNIAHDIPLQVQRITLQPLVIDTPATATPTPTPATIACLKGYTCEPEAVAAQEFGAGNYNQYSTIPCGWTQVTQPSQPQVEYCFVKKVASVKQLAPASVVLQENIVEQAVGGQEAAMGGGGPLPPIEPLPPVPEAPPVITHIEVIDSFLGNIFSGIFGHSGPKPPVNVTLVGTKVTMVGPTIPPGGIFLLDSYTVAPVIDKGATVYIGEQNLDVTRALFQASGSVPPANNNPPNVTAIGWWASPATIYTTSPSKTIDLGIANRYRSMTVAPADFVGYAGNWYLLNWSGNRPWSTDAVVFNVQNPELDLSVKNAASLASVEGTTVTKGTQLRFSITKNMAVRNPLGVANYRSPLAGTRDDGFLDIVVVNPSGTSLTDLDVTTSSGIKTTESLRKSCWDSTLIAPNCNPTYTWDTGATLSNGTAKYQSGTYTVQVISKLNNMKNNYKNGGVPYTGRTVSKIVTFSLA